MALNPTSALATTQSYLTNMVLGSKHYSISNGGSATTNSSAVGKAPSCRVRTVRKI